MGLITSTGLGSGINVEAIIGAILNAERSPKESSLNRNESRVETTLSALGKLSSALSKLDTALEDLSSLSDFKIRTASSSDESYITATTTEEASSGSFSIEVTQLAQGSRLESTAGLFAATSDTVGSGTLTFTAGSETFDVLVGATDTLETIRDSINAESDNFGVSVNIVNGNSGPVLTYTSTITGDGNTLAVTNNNVSLNNISTGFGLTAKEPSLGAIATVNDITVTSDTNTFKDAIQDLSFTALKKTVVDTPITLDVAIDKSAVKEKISSFVSAINEYQTIAQELGRSSETSAGALAGDITLRLLNQKMVTIIQDTVSGLSSNFNSLNSIGVTFDEFGKINLSDKTLDDILTTNFDDVANVFASTNGVSVKLKDFVNDYIGSGSLIALRETSLNNQKQRLEDDRLNLDYRMEQLETQLRRKFGAMDSLVAQFNNTGSFLTQQLANLPGFGGSKS